MIQLGESTVMRSRASWHQDEELNKRQATLLAKDVVATREKLLGSLLKERFGPNVFARRDFARRFKLLVDEQGITWATWKEPGASQAEALALFTHPKTRIQNYHLICEWHWVPLSPVAGKN